MAAIDQNTFLVTGMQYTFSVRQTGLSNDSMTDVSVAMQKIPVISQVTIKNVGGIWGWFANQFDITFYYVGDGSDQVQTIRSYMIGVLDGFITIYDFVGARTGRTGVDTTPDPVIPLPSTTTIVALVIGLTLIVFLASGGPRLVKGMVPA